MYVQVKKPIEITYKPKDQFTEKKRYKTDIIETILYELNDKSHIISSQDIHKRISNTSV